MGLPFTFHGNLLVLLIERQVDMSRRIVVHVVENESVIAARHRRPAAVTSHAAMTTAARPLPNLASLAATTSSHHLPRHHRHSTDVTAQTRWNATAETVPWNAATAETVPWNAATAETVPTPAWITTSVTGEEIAIAIVNVIATVTETVIVTVTALLRETTSVAVLAAEDNTTRCKSYICMYVRMSDMC